MRMGNDHGQLVQIQVRSYPFQVVDMWHNKTITGLHTYVIRTLPTLCLKEGLLSSKRSCLSILRGKDDVPWIMSSSMLWSILLYYLENCVGIYPGNKNLPGHDKENVHFITISGNVSVTR